MFLQLMLEVDKIGFFASGAVVVRQLRIVICGSCNLLYFSTLTSIQDRAKLSFGVCYDLSGSLRLS